jgi:hypothetical protein
MIIKNKINKKMSLVYAFWTADKYVYMTICKNQEWLEFELEDNCVILDRYYSKLWNIIDKKSGIPKKWGKDMYLEQLIDNLNPLENDPLFKEYKLKIDVEYYKLYAHQEKYAELYPQCYQHKKYPVAEELGDNWTMCPNCSEAYEVKKDQGYIECKNATCKIKFNNPYAKKFPSK